MSRPKLPSIRDVAKYLAAIKRATSFDDDLVDPYDPYGDYDAEPMLQITLGVNPDTGSWDIQTGDNSYTGAAYRYPVWGVGYLMKDSNSREVAKEIIEDAASQLF